MDLNFDQIVDKFKNNTIKLHVCWAGQMIISSSMFNQTPSRLWLLPKGVKKLQTDSVVILEGFTKFTQAIGFSFEHLG